MLHPMRDLLQRAKAGRYAVGSFDVPNLETAHAVLTAAHELRAPVILAIPESFFSLTGFEPLVQAINFLANGLPIPIATILDHGKSRDSVVRAIRAGLTTVMFDGSALPEDENVRLTREIVDIAHAVGVSVEGEIGVVGRGTDYHERPELVQQGLTDPRDALAFAEATGVDALAVAVGTIHGHYKSEPTIHYDLLDQIASLTGLPLVLHGGSSTGDQRLSESTAHGVCKVNIYTDMSTAAMKRLSEVFTTGRDRDMRVNDVLGEVKIAFRETAAHYMHVFGSVGRA